MTLLAPNLWAWRVEWAGQVHLSSHVELRRDHALATMYCGPVGVTVPGTLAAYETMENGTLMAPDYRPVDCPGCRDAASRAASYLVLMLAGEEEIWRQKVKFR